MKRLLAILLALLLAVPLTGCGKNKPEETTPQTMAAQEAAAPDENLHLTAQWLLETVPEPGYGSVGGEWMILGLARSGETVPGGFYDNYFQRVATYTAEKSGVLHEKKYTEYSRTILAVTAIGQDATDVGGYDLLQPLADFDKTVFQGLNGPIFALLALDSGDYALPETESGKTQASRELYVDYILNAECDGGGWSLTGGEADVDITAMALQALAKYQDRQDVAQATQRALELLSQQQTEDGGFRAYDAESSETISQVLLALTELGIEPEDDRFVKNGKTLEDRLLEFRLEDGSFRHIMEGEADLMATEQAFYALVGLNRIRAGQSSLYRMAQ